MIEDFAFVLGQLGQVIQHVDEQKLRSYLNRLGKAMLDSGVVGAVAEPELTVAFVVIDDGLVVKLGGAQAQRVIDTGIEAQKILVAQKCRKQILFFGRNFAEDIHFGFVIEPLSQIKQRIGRNQALQFAVNAGRIREKIFTLINLADTNMLVQKADVIRVRRTVSHEYYLIEISRNHTLIFITLALLFP